MAIVISIQHYLHFPPTEYKHNKNTKIEDVFDREPRHLCGGLEMCAACHHHSRLEASTLPHTKNIQ